MAIDLALKLLGVGYVATGHPWKGVEWQTAKPANGMNHNADSRAQILNEAGLFEGGPWLQDTELINDDIRKKILSGVIQPCL